MDKRLPSSSILAAAAIAAIAALAAAGVLAAVDEVDEEARKAKIVSNLKLQYEQLGQVSLAILELEPSRFEGLDQGTLQVGNQRVRFLVSTDDSAFYLISGDAIDVSLTMEEIQVELAKREEEEARKAQANRQEIETAVAGRPFRGNAEAPVTIVEFSDFQCPYCARGATTIEQVLAKYPTDVKFVFKHFPLANHPWAKPAAIASHCAAEQDGEAFWTLHDRYFEHQKEINPQNVLDKSREYLEGSDLDMARWSSCAEDADSEAYKAAAALVDADMAFGQKLGVSGTPGFFVNGRFLNGAQPIATFDPLIAEAREDPAL